MTAALTLGSFVVYSSIQFTRKSWILSANPKPTSMTWGLPSRIATARWYLFWKELLSTQLMKFHKASWIIGANGRRAGHGINATVKGELLSMLFTQSGASKGLHKPRHMSLREGRVKITCLSVLALSPPDSVCLWFFVSLSCLSASLCALLWICLSVPVSVSLCTASLLLVHGI